MKEKPASGQEVYVVHQKRRNGGGEQRFMQVLRAGTKYCYLLIHGREHPFDWRTGASVHKESNTRMNGMGFDVYDSPQDYAKQQYDAMRLRTLKDRLVLRNGWSLVDMPFECVEKIHAVLDEFGIAKGGAE